ncbi:MAG TPA: IPT/TIG domain-containing protein [Candidatus Acidoferrales bacterium]
MNCWRWAALASLAGLLMFGGCGGGSSLTTTNATPVPQSAIPSNITAGSDSFTVFLTGTGFVSSSEGVTFAYWNGAPRSTTFNLTTNQLAVQIPASDVVAAGVGNLTLVNPPPGGGPSQTGLDFTIVAAQPGGRTINSFSPTSANAGDKAFTLTVNGDNFTVNDVVTWNGSVRPTTFMSSAQVSAQIMETDVAVSGSASVAVNAPGLLIASPSVNFPIAGANNASPSISSLSPSSTSAGGEDLQILVKGSGFATSSVVELDNTPLATSYLSGSQLVAVIPAADTAAKGTSQVAVTTPAPGGGLSKTLMFTVN